VPENYPVPRGRTDGAEVLTGLIVGEPGERGRDLFQRNGGGKTLKIHRLLILFAQWPALRPACFRRQRRFRVGNNNCQESCRRSFFHGAGAWHVYLPARITVFLFFH